MLLGNGSLVSGGWLLDAGYWKKWLKAQGSGSKIRHFPY